MDGGVDQRGQTIEQRLHWFIDVCAGVHYADFKHIVRGAQPSPGDAVDPRTDVHALGVLLYELLVGVAPFDKRARPAVFRALCEHGPPTFNERMSTMPGSALAEIAASRQLTPAALSRRLTGELDWIAHTALASDPARRYSTPTELAADIARHLNHQPVRAGPGTLGYRVRKLLRRRRLALALAALITALVAGLLGTATAMVRADRDENLAVRKMLTARQAADFTVALFDIADHPQARGSLTARELLDRSAERVRRVRADQPVAQAGMMAILGELYLGLGLYARAESLLDDALHLRRTHLGARHRDVAHTRVALGRVYRYTGRLTEAEQAIARGLSVYRSARSDDDSALADALYQLGQVHLARREFTRSERLLRRALVIRERAADPDRIAIARISHALGASYLYEGRHERAEPLFRRALTAYDAALGRDDPRVAGAIGNLALLAGHAERYDEADALHREALAIYERALGADHPEVRRLLSNAVWFLFESGRYQDALPVIERAVALDQATGSRDTDDGASRLTSLGLVYWKIGQLDRAAALLGQAIEIRERVLTPDHPRRASSLWALANVYRDQGRMRDAEALYRRALALCERALPPGHADLIATIHGYAALLRMLDRKAEANHLEARVAGAALYP